MTSVDKISQYLGVKTWMEKDNRKSNLMTSKYQFTLEINNEKDFTNVEQKLKDILVDDNCKDTDNKTAMECSFGEDDKWFKFGQIQGRYGFLYPSKYSKDNKVYKINHAIAERLFLMPNIIGKENILFLINKLGKNYSNKTLKNLKKKSLKTKKTRK